MRILLLSRCPPYPLHLGDRLIVWHLARELGKRGHVLDLLAFANSATDWGEQAHYAPFFRQITLLPEPQRRLTDYLRRWLLPAARWPRYANAAWSPAMWHAISQQLEQNSYDVVQVFGGISVYEYRHALADLPAVITPYESYSLYLKRLINAGGGLLDSLFPRLQRALAERFERWMFAPYTRTIVVAQPDADELLRLNPALTIEVIPNGIDLGYFTPDVDSPRDPTMLLFTGNYEYAPNQRAALLLATRILPEIRQSQPDVRLYLVGNAPPPELQALQTEHIIVTGRVPDVRPYLAQAAAFVCPLTIGAGIKNKVLEALAMRCPVVATPLSVDGIAVQHGHDVLLADVNTMAQQVRHLLADRGLQQQLAANGRHLIEQRYSWAGVAARYEAVYQQITA